MIKRSPAADRCEFKRAWKSANKLLDLQSRYDFLRPHASGSSGVHDDGSVEAFKAACEKELRAPGRSFRAAIRAEARGHDNKITPGAKRAAIERNRSLLTAARADIAANVDVNIAETCRRVASFQVVEFRSKGPRVLTNRTVRNLITSKVGVKGNPGRKRRKT